MGVVPQPSGKRKKGKMETVSSSAFTNAVIESFGFESLPDLLEYAGGGWDDECAAFVCWEEFEERFLRDSVTAQDYILELDDDNFILVWRNWSLGFGPSPFGGQNFWNLQTHASDRAALDYLAYLREEI